LAIDQSGSICGTNNLCNNCPDECRNIDDSPLCCSNYDAAVNFAQGFVNGVDSKTDGEFGFVRFASTGTTLTGLTSAVTVNGLLTSTAYTGGWTNTEAGIRLCTTVLDGGNSSKRILVLLTDGNPTACTSTPGSCPCTNCNAAATDEADAAATEARNKNYVVLPVGVGTGISTENLQTWAGTGNTILTVDDFDDLDTILDELIDEVLCE
jgi:hypothetical protein